MSRGRRWMVGLVQVALAAGYGAVLGSRAPLPTGTTIFQLPAVVVVSPLRAPVAAGRHAPDPRSRRHGPSEHEGSLVLATWTPASYAGRPESRATAVDRLPPAPAFAVSTLLVDPTRPPLAAGDGFGPVGGPRPAASARPCPAIIPEGEPVPAGCATRGRPQPAPCLPRGADRADGGPVICIRAAD